ncbi:MAG: hypothetical protein HY435_03365 [Candidatus Liptonbacteria bacterium]|nr:hypothetical protein [Candidatus Liptonbacteria bacterium]
MKTVAVFGSGEGNPGESRYDAMKLVGILLAAKGARIITGGYGGSGMQAPIEGVYHGRGHSTGYVLACRKKDPNPYLGNVVVCGKDVVVEPNNEAMQYSLRLGLLLQADGFVVDPSDPTFGTAVEFFSVVNLNEKFWQKNQKPIVLFSERYRIESYPLVRLVKEKIQRPSYLKHTADPEQAVQWLWSCMNLAK